MAWRALMPHRTAEYHVLRVIIPQQGKFPCFEKFHEKGSCPRETLQSHLNTTEREHHWPHETETTTWEIGSCLTPKKLTHDYSAPSPLPLTITCQRVSALKQQNKDLLRSFLKEIFITSLYPGFYVILKANSCIWDGKKSIRQNKLDSQQYLDT